MDFSYNYKRKKGKNRNGRSDISLRYIIMQEREGSRLSFPLTFTASIFIYSFMPQHSLCSMPGLPIIIGLRM